MRIVGRESEFGAENSSAVEVVLLFREHEHYFPFEDGRVHEADGNSGDVFVCAHLFVLAGEEEGGAGGGVVVVIVVIVCRCSAGRGSGGVASGWRGHGGGFCLGAKPSLVVFLPLPLPPLLSFASASSSSSSLFCG